MVISRDTFHSLIDSKLTQEDKDGILEVLYVFKNKYQQLDIDSLISTNEESIKPTIKRFLEICHHLSLAQKRNLILFFNKKRDINEIIHMISVDINNNQKTSLLHLELVELINDVVTLFKDCNNKNDFNKILEKLYKEYNIQNKLKKEKNLKNAYLIQNTILLKDLSKILNLIIPTNLKYNLNDIIKFFDTNNDHLISYEELLNGLEIHLAINEYYNTPITIDNLKDLNTVKYSISERALIEFPKYIGYPEYQPQLSKDRYDITDEERKSIIEFNNTQSVDQYSVSRLLRYLIPNTIAYDISNYMEKFDANNDGIVTYKEIYDKLNTIIVFNGKSILQLYRPVLHPNHLREIIENINDQNKLANMEFPQYIGNPEYKPLLEDIRQNTITQIPTIQSIKDTDVINKDILTIINAIFPIDLDSEPFRTWKENSTLAVALFDIDGDNKVTYEEFYNTLVANNRDLGLLDQYYPRLSLQDLKTIIHDIKFTNIQHLDKSLPRYIGNSKTLSSLEKRRFEYNKGKSIPQIEGNRDYASSSDIHSSANSSSTYHPSSFMYQNSLELIYKIFNDRLEKIPSILSSYDTLVSNYMETGSLPKDFMDIEYSAVEIEQFIKDYIKLIKQYKSPIEFNNEFDKLKKRFDNNIKEVIQKEKERRDRRYTTIFISGHENLLKRNMDSFNKFVSAINILINEIEKYHIYNRNILSIRDDIIPKRIKSYDDFQSKREIDFEDKKNIILKASLKAIYNNVFNLHKGLLKFKGELLGSNIDNVILLKRRIELRIKEIDNLKRKFLDNYNIKYNELGYRRVSHITFEDRSEQNIRINYYHNFVQNPGDYNNNILDSTLYRDYFLQSLEKLKENIDFLSIYNIDKSLSTNIKELSRSTNELAPNPSTPMSLTLLSNAIAERRENNRQRYIAMNSAQNAIMNNRNANNRNNNIKNDNIFKNQIQNLTDKECEELKSISNSERIEDSDYKNMLIKIFNCQELYEGYVIKRRSPLNENISNLLSSLATNAKFGKTVVGVRINNNHNDTKEDYKLFFDSLNSYIKELSSKNTEPIITWEKLCEIYNSSLVVKEDVNKFIHSKDADLKQKVDVASSSKSPATTSSNNLTLR